MSEKIVSLLDNNDISYFYTVGEINTNINLNNYLKEAYGLDELRENYQEVLDMIEENNKFIGNKKTETIDLLPKLGYTGWLFYTLVIKDPFLPKEIMKDWIGDKAVEEFKYFREKTFSKIINDLFKKRKEV